MGLTRRQFIGFLGALGMGGCARIPMPQLPKPSLPFEGGPDGPLTFAAINDLHILDAKSTGIVNRAVADINANPNVHFTVVIGDLGTDGTYSELNMAKSCLDRLERPYFAVPGNHDVDPTAVNDVYHNYTGFFGEPQWDEEEKGWLFIGLDTCNGTASEVTVPAERIEWLRAQVERVNPERPIALFGHHPFNPNTKAYRVQNAEEVLAVFEGRNLKLVASGHYHGNQVEERDGVLFTTTACCSTTRDNFDGTEAKGYRIFRLEENTLVSEFVEVKV